MAKKSKKVKELERILLEYVVEQMKSREQFLAKADMNAETPKGVYEHAKAAEQKESQRAEMETNQMKVLLFGFEKQQHELNNLKKELAKANKRIKSLKTDSEKHLNRQAVLSNQILELDHELGSVEKAVKIQKKHTKQLVAIVKSFGSIFRICKMSDSLEKAKNKFLDASSEAKAHRKRSAYLFEDTSKIIDGNYREVSK